MRAEPNKTMAIRHEHNNDSVKGAMPKWQLIARCGEILTENRPDGEEHKEVCREECQEITCRERTLDH